MELYKKYRPRRFSDMIGQDAACTSMAKLLKRGFPHASLFSGPSGCGKTTLARILARKLECHERDIFEYNCAESRGIDMVRDVKAQMGLAPIGGKAKLYILDEAQKLTGDAQSALLKMLEDTPRHVFFALATTDPHKLLPTIRTRCSDIRVVAVSDKLIASYAQEISAKEGNKVSLSVAESIAEKAEGSMRRSLVLLEMVMDVSSEEGQLEALEKADVKTQAIQIARALISPSVNWKDIASILKNLEDDPESVRRLILGYCGSIILGGGRLAPRALFLVDVFSANFFDTGKPGLIAACYAASCKRG